VHRPARRRLAVRDDEVRELRAALRLPERRDAERSRRLRRDARSGVAHPDVDVVDDHPRPVPVHVHDATLQHPLGDAFRDSVQSSPFERATRRKVLDRRTGVRIEHVFEWSRVSSFRDSS
jgi:hypothetical protein